MNPSRLPKALIPAAYLLLCALEGGLALAVHLGQPSEAQNAFWRGFSKADLAIAGLILAGALLFALAGLLLLARGRAERLLAGLESRLECSILWPALLAGLAAAALLAIGWNEVLATLLFGLKQLRPLLIWVALILLQACLAVWLLYPQTWRRLFRLEPPETARALWIGLLPAALLAAGLYLATPPAHLGRYQFVFGFTLAGMAFVAALGWLNADAARRPRDWHATARAYLTAAAVFCVVFVAYRLSAILVGNILTPAKSYFDELADAWLHGQLYLGNPSDTHDLTLFQGQWYVANPPLVAILMVPLVWAIHLVDFNTVVYACANGALNAALLYLLLSWVGQRGWLSLGAGGRLWLTAFFAFGTAHYYLSTDGRMWFLSQQITVTLILLAAGLAVTRKPAWLSGAALAVAVVARPHILVIAPLVVGIWWQNAREDGLVVNWKRLAGWALALGIPILFAGGGLLFYNWLRFGNVLDYGYLTENVADFMAGDLKNYGTFHPHFILRNLRVMFLNLPLWKPACGGLAPSVEGLSMLIASPALVYLAAALPNKGRRQPWMLGAWAAILCVLIPLALYYNTGAWQFGYKYLLDFLVPVMLLLGLAAGEKLPRGMLLLILASMAINLYGVLWWYGIVCR
ncbi:MAG TPA: hypothetical protein PJ988_00600 [Anaerolinea sp.]|nr:hypothetical protein [Anaerolinea sp.]